MIVIATLIFRNPVTPLNALGMATASIGVGLYNREKYLERAANERKAVEKAQASQGLSYLAAAAVDASKRRMTMDL